MSIALALTTRPTCGSALSSGYEVALCGSTGKDSRHEEQCGLLEQCEASWQNGDSSAWFAVADNKSSAARLNAIAAFSSTTQQMRRVARCVDLSVVTTFAHARPELLSEARPGARALFLFRQTAAHRLSLFRSLFLPRSNSSPNKTSNTFGFYDWVVSDEYVDYSRGKRGAHNLQVRFVSNFTRRAAVGGAAGARAVLAERRVAWVGVTESWEASMCTLERVLGIPLFYEFARKSNSRLCRGRHCDEDRKIGALWQQLSAQVFGAIAERESGEMAFVAYLQRRVAEDAAAAACG